MNREPVAIAAAVRTLLVCAVLFGLDLSEEQIAGVVIALETVLALFTRNRVTPVE